MNISVRNIQGEEMLETLYALNSYSLHPSPPFQNKEEWMAVVRERQDKNCWALFEDEVPVSVAVSTPMMQNMRGKLFPAAGVWGVSTLPPGRRKGYCRQVMTNLLAADHENGKVFSNLYPFRESFYERMGYVAYPLTKIARLTARSLASLLKMNLGGEIRQQYISEAYDSYREYLSAMREHRHGMAFFDFGDLGRVKQNLLWSATAEFEGIIEGIMLYRTSGAEVTKYDFIAARFYYTTSRARYLLLSWIARHIDQVEQVEIWLPEDEYPDTWLADLQVKIESTIHPGMNRILDVASIWGMEAGDGSFSARIIDPLCAWNEGCWYFEGSQGRLAVSKASLADCDLTIQGLTALVAGVHDPQDFPLRGWGDSDSEIQTIQRKMFPKLRPFMHEMF